MATATTGSRRALWRLAVGRTPQLKSDAGRSHRELVVLRRAMACEFSLRFPAGTRGAVAAGCAALDEVERLEGKLSVYRDDSDISRLNQRHAGSAVRVDAEAYGLLRAAARLSAATGGAFDAASGALVEAWGFLRGPKRVPSESEIAAALAVSGSSHLVFDDAEFTIRASNSIHFNLGGIGKGFAIDRAFELLRGRYSIGCCLMQGGQSSMKAMGTPPGESRGWPVAIGDPLRPGRVIARIWLRNRALGTSAADHQFFTDRGRRFGHILDPRTGWPARGTLSATAIAASAAEADALSTAFFVMGPEATHRFCAAHPQYGAVLLVPGESIKLAPQVLIAGAALGQAIVVCGLPTWHAKDRPVDRRQKTIPASHGQAVCPTLPPAGAEVTL